MKTRHLTPIAASPAPAQRGGRRTLTSADTRHGQLDDLALPGLRVIAEPEYRDHCVRVRAEQVPVSQCPKCGCATREFRLNGTRAQTVLDEPRGSRRVQIELRRRSYVCEACDTTGLPPLRCVSERRRLTRRLVDYIGREALLRPFLEIAQKVGVSHRTVREIFLTHKDVLARNVTFSTPQVMGLDGVYIDGEERAVLTDIETKTIITILDFVEKDQLYEYLANLPDRDKVKVVVMDMAGGLRNAVERALPNAVIVIDRYHIQRLANKGVDIVRQRLRKGIARRKGVKTMCHAELLRKHREQLTPKEAERLDEWFEALPALRLAYETKEQFFKVWHSSSSANARQRYQKWLAQFPLSLRRDFEKLLGAMEARADHIFNFFEHRHTNALTESLNRRIKDILRESRGCDLEVVRVKAIYGAWLRKKLQAARAEEGPLRQATKKRQDAQQQVKAAPKGQALLPGLEQSFLPTRRIDFQPMLF